MTGTKAGGMKAAATNKAKHGEDFYARIGKKGGSNGHTGGFYNNPELAKIAGKKGGQISRRTGVKNKKPSNSKEIIENIDVKVEKSEPMTIRKGFLSRLFGSR